MSKFFKHLCDYELVKKCGKCGNISLKSNFHKNINRKDGVNSMCKVCKKKCYLKNNDKIILKTNDWNENNPEKVKQDQKKYNEQNKEKRKVYVKNKRETSIKFLLISNTRNRICKPLKGVTKQ